MLALSFIICYLLYQGITAASKKRKEVSSEQPMPAPVVKNQLEYIVNNRKIPCAFERYYYIKLNMPLPVIRIDPDVIERQYQRRLQDQELDTKALNDVEAANRYFIDRIGYLSHLN